MSSKSVTRLRRRVAKVVLATLKKIGGSKGLSFKKIYETIRDEYPNTPRDIVNINNTLQKAIAFGVVAQKKDKKMSIKSFDNLLHIIKDDIVADANAVWYCISPEEKLIVTLRYVLGSVVKEIMDKRGGRIPYYVIEGPKRSIRQKRKNTTKRKLKNKN